MSKSEAEQRREEDFDFVIERLHDRHAHAAFLEGMMNSLEYVSDLQTCKDWTHEYTKRVSRQMEVVRGEIFALDRLGTIIERGEVFEVTKHKVTTD